MLKDFFTRELDGFATRARDAHAETKQSIESVDSKVTDVQRRVTILETNLHIRASLLRRISWLIGLLIPAVPVGIVVLDRLTH